MIEEQKQKDLTGAIFPNKKKDEQKEHAPHFTGKCLIDGKTYYISGWGNFSKDGEKYVSLVFNEPKPVQAKQKASDEMLNEF